MGLLQGDYCLFQNTARVSHVVFGMKIFRAETFCATFSYLVPRFGISVVLNLRRIRLTRQMQYLDLSFRPDRCFVCGDIHGEFETLVFEIKRRRISGATVIVAGDCGFGFYRPQYYDNLYKRKLHGRLEAMDVLLLMVRGNHDDPVYFEKELIDYPHMKTLPDYTVVHTASRNILCVGGAVSVDRQFRLSMMDMHRMEGRKAMPLYWPGEAFRYDEREMEVLELEGMRIDTVVTHIAPSFCPPKKKKDLLHFCANDEDLADDIRRERGGMDTLYNWLAQHGHPLCNWFYSHYHDSALTVKDGTSFRLLNINEIAEI